MKTTTILGQALTLVGLGIVAIACGRSYDTRPAAAGSAETTGAAGRDANDASIEKLSTAKCEREERCSNVGQGKKYASKDSCLTENRSSNRSELRSNECPGGIDQRQLDKCLAEIKAEHCGNALDKIGRLTACRDAALCMN